ncbi:MAG: hypothetical protein E7177_04420 [Erysipelotrichaceae bacterium]|nr:hypothetical protein [Erysipelotrichaceae bacterium]
MKYFKTDGIRMKGNELIFSLIPLKLGRLLGNHSKKVCIGYDTRISSSEIFDLLVTGLITRGCDVISLGVCPTSVVGSITKEENCDYGIMITASHNPYFDNGIKVFSSNGEKLTSLEERELDSLLNQNIVFNQVSKLGKVENKEELVSRYILYLRNLLKDNKDIKVLFDVSNGVQSEIIEKVVKGKINYKIINNSPNGKNINLNVGSEHIDCLINNMDESFTYGVSFDGDADRVVIVNQNKEIITGEDLLFLFSKEYNYSSIVTTKMSNIGLIEELNRNNKKVFISNVGDKNVYRMMKDENVLIGGESSGHIIFLNSLYKNDGLFTFIKYLNLENKEVNYNKYFSKTRNFLVENKDLNNSNLLMIENQIKNELKEKGKVYIRKSGTEDYLRVNIQLKNKEKELEVDNLLEEYLKDVL